MVRKPVYRSVQRPNIGQVVIICYGQRRAPGLDLYTPPSYCPLGVSSTRHHWTFPSYETFNSSYWYNLVNILFKVQPRTVDLFSPT